MSQTLGEKLRIAREERGISISEVAEQTRISPLYLKAIDADDYKTLPGGIFNKGFIRSYAKYVGVDEQEALKEYNRFVAAEEASEEGSLKSYRPEVLTDDRAASSFIPTVIFAVIILGLMTAGILVLVNYIQNQQTDNQASVNSPAIGNLAASNTGANVTTPATGAQAPTMSNLKVAFSAAGDEVWLRSVTDGKSSEALIKPGNSVTFEPKQSLSLRYSRSRAQFAQLSLNGKEISLPQQPAEPNQANIELTISEANLNEIWLRGQIDFGTEPAADANSAAPGTTATRATPRPTAADPAQPGDSENANGAAPAANVPTMTNRPTMSNRANTRPTSSPAANRSPSNRPAANRPSANIERP
ncbi:MAG: helix-turn-helix domain-containing protein [Chloracidobacterium sp.]|nr:helix-turn-helix domain-containing protein [Chloracidobacterium sp.]